MSAASASVPDADWARIRRPIIRDAVSIGIAVAIYGVSFGALGAASGLSVAQTCVLSLLMFTGASQFAFVSVIASGGSPVAAVTSALLLGTRNTFYALRMSTLLAATGLARPAAAQLTIDESTAMALAHEPTSQRAGRLGFWATGISVFVFWNLATALGAFGAQLLGDPRTIGLDAAIGAGLFALLWPRLKDRLSWAVALGAAAVALALTPVLQPGLPVLMAALVAVVAGFLTEPTSEEAEMGLESAVDGTEPMRPGTDSEVGPA